MKTQTKLLMATGLLATIGLGCSERVGDFTALSTKNVYAKGIDLTKLEKKTEEAKEPWKFLFIGSNVKDPTDQALEAGGGNLMLDAVVYRDYFWIFGGFRVRGSVVNVPYTGPAPAGGAPDANPLR